MGEIAAWIAFGAVQVLLVALAGVLVVGPRGRSYDWFVLAGSGVILAGVNVAWLLTGGGGEPSSLAMRGGAVGLWLPILVATELAMLGVLSFFRHRAG